MKRRPAWLDGLLAIAESSLYSPVWVLPALLIAGALVPEHDSWWIVKLHGLRSDPKSAFTVVGLLVILRPVILFVGWLVLVTFGIVVVRRSWAEKLGNDLVKCVRQGLPVDAIRAALNERREEGNADAPHVDAIMWSWVIARHDGDLELEEECERRIRQYVARAPLKERAIVWCLRAWAKLGGTHGNLLPPICASALQRR